MSSESELSSKFQLAVYVKNTQACHVAKGLLAVYRDLGKELVE